MGEGSSQGHEKRHETFTNYSKEITGAKHIHTYFVFTCSYMSLLLGQCNEVPEIDTALHSETCWSTGSLPTVYCTLKVAVLAEYFIFEIISQTLMVRLITFVIFFVLFCTI